MRAYLLPGWEGVDDVAGEGEFSYGAEHLSGFVAVDSVREQQRRTGHWGTALDLCSLELLGAAVGVNLLIRAATSLAAATPGWWPGSSTERRRQDER